MAVPALTLTERKVSVAGDASAAQLPRSTIDNPISNTEKRVQGIYMTLPKLSKSKGYDTFHHV